MFHHLLTVTEVPEPPLQQPYGNIVPLLNGSGVYSMLSHFLLTPANPSL